jgi:hypothetical protein
MIMLILADFVGFPSLQLNRWWAQQSVAHQSLVRVSKPIWNKYSE